MIYGIGTDIVEIGRIREAVEKWGDHFLRKIFTDSEIGYCNKKKDPYPHLAARFAAKEAVIKALSKDNPEIPGFKDIEILNHPNGKPFINSEKLQKYTAGLSCNIHLSISHERKNAIANVIIEILKEN